jgi:hypothetical protein
MVGKPRWAFDSTLAGRGVWGHRNYLRHLHPRNLDNLINAMAAQSNNINIAPSSAKNAQRRN